MASKFMGAKMLKKQLAKEGGKSKARSKAAVFDNKGEFLDRKKQRFEMSQSQHINTEDFDAPVILKTNPEFDRIT